MYLDSQSQFSDSQAVTASAVGSNVIDLTVDQSIGNGTPLAVMFVVKVAADVSSGDEDYTFDVEYASNAAQTTGRQLIGRRVFETSPTAPAQNATLLAVGFKVIIPLPPTKLSESEQFIGVRYVTAGVTPTITVDAFLMPLSMIDATDDYDNAYNIT